MASQMSDCDLQVQQVAAAAVHGLLDTQPAVSIACQQALLVLARQPGCLLAMLQGTAQMQTGQSTVQLRAIARQPPAKQLSSAQHEKLLQLMSGRSGDADHRCALCGSASTWG